MTENPDPRAAASRPHRFGVAAELDRVQKVPAPRPPVPLGRSGAGAHPLDHHIWQCRSRARTGAVEGRAWAHARFWWANWEHRPGELWRRMKCRRGRHEIRGGHSMQLGSRLVYVERCCAWCGARPERH